MYLIYSKLYILFQVKVFLMWKLSRYHSEDNITNYKDEYYDAEWWDNWPYMWAEIERPPPGKEKGLRKLSTSVTVLHSWRKDNLFSHENIKRKWTIMFRGKMAL